MNKIHKLDKVNLQNNKDKLVAVIVNLGNCIEILQYFSLHVLFNNYFKTNKSNNYFTIVFSSKKVHRNNILHT